MVATTVGSESAISRGNEDVKRKKGERKRESVGWELAKSVRSQTATEPGDPTTTEHVYCIG